MRIVLLGKNGQLGWELEQLLPRLGTVYAFGKGQLDVSNLQALESKLRELKPDLIVNASAYTDVDRAEKEPQTALSVNAQAPGLMAETARKTGAVFFHFSTDYVFDGNRQVPYTENEDTNPLNVYGRSKLTGERNIEQAGGAFLILRTSWVYSMRGNSFVSKFLAWARNSETIKIVDDQVSNPTWARALAEATCRLISTYRGSLQDVMKERCGIYHVAGNGYTSRFKWAQQILANASRRTDLLVRTIEPVPSETFPLPAIRPRFSALDCSKIEDIFDIHLPDWEDSLKMAMKE